MAKKKPRRRAYGAIVQVRVRGRVAPGYYVRYRTIDPDGRRKIVQKKAGDTRAEAEEELHRIALRLKEEEDLLRAGKIRNVSLADFASLEYLPFLEAKSGNVHLAHVVSRVDAASRYFGNRPMRSIDRADMEEYFAAIMRGAVPPRIELDEAGNQKKPRKRRAPHSTNTLHHHRACLQPLWRAAVERKAAVLNPFQGLHLPRVKEFPVPYILPEQLRKLVAACPPRIKAFVALLSETGLRAGEAAALRWSAVAADFSSLTVVKSKSGKVRMVPLTPTAKEVLRGLDEQRTSIPLEGDPLVFPELPGPNARLDAFKAAAVRIGLPKTLRLHDLRHAFASHLAQSGVPLATIAELCGHGSLQMVQRYAKHVPGGAAAMAIQALARTRALPTPRSAELAPQREVAAHGE